MCPLRHAFLSGLLCRSVWHILTPNCALRKKKIKKPSHGVGVFCASLVLGGRDDPSEDTNGATMFNTFGKTLLACASLSVIAATGGMAQTATAAARIPDEGTRIAFEIPAQSVSQSLQMFARQSGYRILFSEESVRSLRASAVTGSLSPRAALDRILAGTRLEVASVNGKVIALGERKTAAAGARRALPATRMAPQSETAPVASGDTLAAAEPAAAEIVVTGTLIRNPALTSATPVQSTGAEEIQLRQANTAEELLRELPGVVPSLGSAVNIGNPGYSFVDLRGLGSNRNVVLLDGQRIAPADLYGRVDLNNIPLALIERVDNLTGGASTTYGADAVSGVVNFVTRKDFEGVEINVSDQITSRGDGNYFNADITAGHNFADGRGNIVLSYGYQNANPVYQGDRSFGEAAIDSFSGGVSGSGTTTPARFTLLGQNGGNVQVNPETGGFNEGYVPFNYAPYNLFQLPFERHNVFGAAHYEVADGIELYGRGLYSKNTSTTIVAASGVSGSVVSIPLSNPFLGDGQRSMFCADAGMTSVQCGAAAVATDPNDPNFRAVDQQLWYRSVGLGPRVDEYQTELYDLRAGLRGALTDTINFDVSGSYGESMNKHIQDEGFMSLSATRDALMATSTGACLSGNPGCVPINIFGGPEALTPEMAEYVTVRPYSETKASLLQF